MHVYIYIYIYNIHIHILAIVLHPAPNVPQHMASIKCPHTLWGASLPLFTALRDADFECFK